MIDALDHLTDILIGLAILFLVPLIYIGLKQDELIRSVVSDQTAKIMDETRSQGYLSRDMFEEFQQSLSKTGLLYDIKLEHKQKIMEPEYRFRTIDEILEEQNKAFTGPNVYHYYPVSTNIPVVTDPIDNSGLTMNTETNASILAKSTNTPSTGHVHTDACYSHKHIGLHDDVEMQNIPVIIQKVEGNYLYSDDGSSRLGYYRYGVEIRCAVCGDSLYSFYISPSYSSYDPLYIYCRMYTYSYIGTYRSIKTITTTTTVPGYTGTEGHWTSSAKYRAEISFDNMVKYTEYLVRGLLPWPGLPIWDTNGNVGYIPFTGCTNTNSEKHINIDACYPSGKKTKVIITTAMVSNSNDFIGLYDREGHINISCAECNKPIVALQTRASVMFTAYPVTNGDMDDRIFTNAQCSFVGYNASGNIEWFTYGISSDLRNRNQQQCDEFNQVNNVAWSIISVIESVQDKKSKVIDYPFQGVLVPRLQEPGKIMSWVNYRGCPYCGTFGSAYTCGKSESTKCDKVIASIVPTHPVQAVYTGEALITTVTVTYLDGSTKVAVASTDFNTSTLVTNKTVTLSMTDAQGNTKTCSITVTVVPRNKTCIHGHIYNLSNDGSDPGCPFCRAWLASLAIEFPTTPTFTIYRGTNLSENGVTLLATYLDGRTELLESGYIDNLDKYYVGSQSVTISYKGHYVYLTVVTKRNLQLCPVCHRQYELHPDDSDPGCPWCAAHTPIFTGNVMQYYTKKYTRDVLEALYEGEGIYRFTDEDFLKISVKSKRGSTGTRLLSAIYLINNVDTIHVIKGGYIREDGYYYK